MWNWIVRAWSASEGWDFQNVHIFPWLKSIYCQKSKMKLKSGGRQILSKCHIFHWLEIKSESETEAWSASEGLRQQIWIWRPQFERGWPSGISRIPSRGKYSWKLPVNRIGVLLVIHKQNQWLEMFLFSWLNLWLLMIIYLETDNFSRINFKMKHSQATMNNVENLKLNMFYNKKSSLVCFLPISMQ